MAANDSLTWTRYDAAVALIRIMDTYRVMADVSLMRQGQLRMLSEAQEEYDRLTSIDRAQEVIDRIWEEVGLSPLARHDVY